VSTVGAPAASTGLVGRNWAGIAGPDAGGAAGFGLIACRWISLMWRWFAMAFIAGFDVAIGPAACCLCLGKEEGTQITRRAAKNAKAAGTIVAAWVAGISTYQSLIGQCHGGPRLGFGPALLLRSLRRFAFFAFVFANASLRNG